MRREVPSTRMPTYTERMFVLSPAAKIAGGVLLVGMALGALSMGLNSLYTYLVVVPGLSFGPFLLWQGGNDIKAAREQEQQMDRAKLEIDDLRLQIKDLDGGKRGLERFLFERGYTQHKVRRWIALECDIVLPATSLL